MLPSFAPGQEQPSEESRARSLGQALSQASGERRVELARELESARQAWAAGALAQDAPDDDVGYAFVLACLSLTEVDAAEYGSTETAPELFAAARAAAQALGDSSTRANVEWRRALHARRVGELAAAEEILLEAIAELGERRAMEPLLKLEYAELLRQRSATSAAEVALDEAQAGLRDESDGYAVHAATRCGIYGARGQLDLDLGLPDRAALWFEREHALAMELGDLDLYLAALLHRANLSSAIEDFDEVTRIVDEASGAPWFASANRAARAQLLVRKGIALSELARVGRAELVQASELFIDVLEQGALEESEALLVELALVDLALRAGGSRTEALRTAAFERARSWLERARQRLLRCKARDLASQPLQLEARLAALESTLAISSGASLEERRAAALRLDVALQAFFSRWRATRLRPGGLGFLHYGSRRQLLGAKVNAALDLEGPERGPAIALEALVQAQALGTLSRRLGAVPTTAPGIARFFAGRVGLVYLAGPDGSHLFVVHGAEVVHAELPSMVELERLRSEFNDEVLRSPAGLAKPARAERRERLRSSGEALAAALLPEELRSVLERSERLTVVGLETLGYVPFEALPLGELRELGSTHAVDYLASIPLGVCLAGERADAEGVLDLVLLADPELSQGWLDEHPAMPPLGLERERLGPLLEVYGASRAQLLVAAEASFTRLEESLGGSPRVLQILAHGVFDMGRERSSGIALAQEAGAVRVLWCADAERLSAPPLVILSACGAARGPRRRGGDGLAHLGGAFLVAGARAVISSVADLELEATLSLSEVLHRELRAGASPASALRAARRELAKSEAFADPFYRCLVHASGLGQEPLFQAAASEPRPSAAPTSPFDWRPLLLGVALLLGGAVLLRRQRAKP